MGTVLALAAASDARSEIPLLSQAAQGTTADDSHARLTLARAYVHPLHIADLLRFVSTKVGAVGPESDAKPKYFGASQSKGLDAVLLDILEASAGNPAKPFTTEEPKEMVVFCDTPSGQSMVSKTPPLLLITMPTTIQRPSNDHTTAPQGRVRRGSRLLRQ